MKVSKLYLLSVFILIIISFSCLTVPVQKSSLSNKNYDALLVVDISEIEKPFYMYLSIENMKRRYIYNRDFEKKDINAGDLVVLQVKSNETYFILDEVHYSVPSIGLTFYCNLPLADQTKITLKEGQIGWMGKIFLKMEGKPRFNPRGGPGADMKVEYNYLKQQERYKEVLNTIIKNYKNEYWVEKAKEILGALK